MRTCVRVRFDPPRRPRRLLRLRGTAGRPRAAGQAGRGRRRGGDGGELRGARVRRALGDGRARGAAAVPGARGGAGPLGGLPGGEPGRARGVRGDPARRSSQVSVDEAFLDVRGRGRRPAGGRRSGSAARCGRGSACRSRSASRAPGCWRRWRARPPSRTACGCVEPDDEEAFLHPLSLEKLWGLGPASARKLHARGLRTVGDLVELSRARAGGDPRPRPRAPDPSPGRAPGHAAGRAPAHGPAVLRRAGGAGAPAPLAAGARRRAGARL